MNKLQKIPTEQLVGELLSRGCLKVNTEVRSPYQLGHKLVQTGYGHFAEIKAQTVLVVPPFTIEWKRGKTLNLQEVKGKIPAIQRQLNGGQKKIVVIDGPSGPTGKTTAARILADAGIPVYEEYQVIRITMDEPLF